MLIQKAVPDDIEQLIDFQQRLAFETENVVLDAQTLRRGMKAMFDEPAKGIYYVVKENADIIGCHMITYEWSDWRNGTVWWLQSVYVIESHRKKGVFKMMYDNLVNTIKQDPQLVGLRLYADKTNERALKVYNAMGMDGSHYAIFEWMK